MAAGTHAADLVVIGDRTSYGRTMQTKRAAAKSIDEYITAFPQEVQSTLKKIRAAIRKAAPGVEETISYQIPAFRLDKRYVVYMAAFKSHIGLYPLPAGDAAFKKATAPYRSGKASLRLPLDQPIPFDIVERMVKLRVQGNQDWAKAKAKAKSSKAKLPKAKAIKPAKKATAKRPAPKKGR
jgi:uncharacterized protein YdhG (YjbR/CyaY superfamily)